MREIWRVKYSRISSRISESTSSRGLVKLDMMVLHTFTLRELLQWLAVYGCFSGFFSTSALSDVWEIDAPKCLFHKRNHRNHNRDLLKYCEKLPFV